MGRNILFTEEQIQERVRELAAEISRDYHGQDVVLVGLLKGAFMLTRDLGAELERIKERGDGVGRVFIEFLSIGSYGDGHESGDLRLDSDLRRSVQDTHVIIVEDVADTCRTLAWVVNHMGKKESASLKVCVLIDKPDNHTESAELHYVGFSKAGLPFLGGYGLDVEGADRCVLHIFEVPPTRPE